MSYVTDINGKQFKKQKETNFIWSFWTRLVVRSLFLYGPFGPVWCDLYSFIYLIFLDPFGGAIFEFYLILLVLCFRYGGPTVITNMPIYLVHCDLRCHM